jgi:hypothetical protein
MAAKNDELGLTASLAYNDNLVHTFRLFILASRTLTAVDEEIKSADPDALDTAAMFALLHRHKLAIDAYFAVRQKAYSFVLGGELEGTIRYLDGHYAPAETEDAKPPQ